MEDRLVTYIRRSVSICTWVAAIALLPLMLLTVIDVILRGIFRLPILGILDYSSFMLVLVIWLGIAYTQQSGKHIRMDLIISRLPEKRLVFFDIVGHVVGLWLVSIITWITLRLALESWRIKEIADISRFPVYPFKTCLFLGAAILALEIVAELILDVVKIRRRGTS